MKIDYYFSVLSPFSYLGAERFLKLVTKYDLDIQEKPFDIIGLPTKSILNFSLSFLLFIIISFGQSTP